VFCAHNGSENNPPAQLHRAVGVHFSGWTLIQPVSPAAISQLRRTSRATTYLCTFSAFSAVSIFKIPHSGATYSFLWNFLI
jgi:hypothetical protein